MLCYLYRIVSNGYFYTGKGIIKLIQRGAHLKSYCLKRGYTVNLVA